METRTLDKVLVTGATGWLGSRLIEALAPGLPEATPDGLATNATSVRALALPGQDTSKLEMRGERVQPVEGDIRNPEDCARLCEDAKGGTLIHTAGIIHPRRVREFYEINLEGTKNLLEAATEAGLQRTVIVSSNSPCGCNPHPDHLFDEQSPYNPYMHYGRSKMLMEQAVNEWRKRGDLETVLIRAPWFYGPNQPARQTLFFQMIRDGKAPIVGGGENLRSMAYVDNLCQGLLLAATVEQANGQTYWIADREPYSMNRIIDTIERLLEQEFGETCQHKRMRLPGLASELAYWIDKTIQGVGLYHQKFHVLSEMNKTIACSVARAERELGYDPKIALEEGMRRSLAWCREHDMWF